ncbi:MAG: putative membrane-anchored protein, partial [Burkholderiaceae bacterium]
AGWRWQQQMRASFRITPTSFEQRFDLRTGTIMNASLETSLAKVPEVTLVFWIIKIAATTLGETGGDAVSMSMNLGYLVGSIIFLAVFLLAVFAQIKAKTFQPLLYWTTIIATTTVGTTLADFADRSLGIGYAGGSALLTSLLFGSLLLWHRTLGSVSVSTVSSPKAELFYWVTIMFSQTLGTALGDWTASTAGLGYAGAAIVFGALLALVVALYYWTTVSRTLLFWAAFILTRPLGAVVGDFLDKPLNAGGLALSRYSASAALFAFILISILLFKQNAARTAH